MLINYTTEAFASLSGLINFIEANNTTNAGLRWLNRFEKFLSTTLINSDKIRFCNNTTFNKLNLRCIYFNDWVVAFSIHSDYILIEALLHKSRITD
jgi:hypothetical protein